MDDGMSDERDPRQGRWLSWGPAVVFAFCTALAYQSAHYATAAVVYEPGYCCGLCTHKLAGNRVPDWVDSDFFALGQACIRGTGTLNLNAIHENRDSNAPAYHSTATQLESRWQASERRLNEIAAMSGLGSASKEGRAWLSLPKILTLTGESVRASPSSK
jgi:hypothetical protein